MSSQNGTVARRTFSAVPKTITFNIETEADGIVPFVGYCKGGACPITVVIEAEQAVDAYREKSLRPATEQEREIRATWEAMCADQGDDPGPSPIRADGMIMDSSHATRLELHRDLLVAVLPGLSILDANRLANDDGPWAIILGELGWWVAPSESVADPEAEGEGESPSTGDASSPNSAPSTPASTS